MIVEGLGRGGGGYFKGTVRLSFSEPRSAGGKRWSWEGSGGKGKAEQTAVAAGHKLREGRKLGLSRVGGRQGSLHRGGDEATSVQEQQEVKMEGGEIQITEGLGVMGRDSDLSKKCNMI